MSVPFDIDCGRTRCALTSAKEQPLGFKTIVSDEGRIYRHARPSHAMCEGIFVLAEQSKPFKLR